MSLKDEIDNLIRAEQDKLKSRDEKYKEYDQQQRNRFASLRVILEQICQAVDSKYLEATLGESWGTLQLGHISVRSNEWEPDIRWSINPNYEWNPSAKAGEATMYAKPGFILKEVNYYDLPGLPYDERTSEKEHTFSDEKSLSEYLIEAITKKVAQYRHWEKAE